MSDVLDHVLALLDLERIEENIFRGQSQDLGWGRVFGGQVLGQALMAAGRTVPDDRQVHSFHAYFLRPGDVKAPIVYDVDRIRDGSSFTTRRVVAVQHGEAIFNLAASFQKPEEGFSHQEPMPKVPAPESLPTDQERLAAHAKRLPGFMRESALSERAFEMRTVDDGEGDPIYPEALGPHRAVWLRTTGKVGDAPLLHACLLAYASDYSFLTTALRPHGISWLSAGVQLASIDHVMWFHEPFRADDWLLHVIDSPKAHGARGLVRGSVYARDGRLVASTAQEGLMRKRTPAA
jgi:acyl-CoA thioesterase-2